MKPLNLLNKIYYYEIRSNDVEKSNYFLVIHGSNINDLLNHKFKEVLKHYGDNLSLESIDELKMKSGYYTRFKPDYFLNNELMKRKFAKITLCKEFNLIINEIKNEN